MISHLLFMNCANAIIQITCNINPGTGKKGDALPGPKHYLHYITIPLLPPPF